jgi:AraC family transcriptional regulator
MMFHPSGLTHRDEIGRRGGHFLSIEMEPHWLERLGEYSSVPDTVVRVEEGSAALAVRLYREFQSFDVCSPLAIEGLVMAMLADLARARVKDERQMPEWLSRAVDQLHDEFRQPLNITSVAAAVGVHPFHLSRVFRQYHQETIGEYINKLRVQYACMELTNLETEIADVALGAGFADQSHLTRIFKRVTGMTPGAYRKTSKGR